MFMKNKGTIDANTALIQFNDLVDRYLEDAIETSDMGVYEGINQRSKHTISTIHDGKEVMSRLNICSQFQELGTVAAIDHEIGSIINLHCSGIRRGTKKNFELVKESIEDALLKKQIPSTRVYDETVKRIIGNHETEIISPEDLEILATGIMYQEDLYSIFKSNDEELKRQIGSVLLQVLQDVNRFEVVYQMMAGRFGTNNKPVDSAIWNRFKNGEPLDVASICRDRKWNLNVGELVRLSFINQIRLLETAMFVRDNQFITRIERQRNNPFMAEAYDVARERLDLMIADSDGITVDAKRIKLTK